MVIKGYLQTSVIEWPGKISSVVFTAGCNFRCSFCYNSGLVDPNRRAELQEISEESVIEDLLKRKKWIDALVVTGGEPCLQPDLPEFLKIIKSMGFLTMIETNGSRPETIAKLLNDKIIDRIAMDIKGPLDQYTEITKIENGEWIMDKIKESIKIILNSGIEYEFRTTVVPGIHDVSVIQDMLKDLKQLSNGAMKQLHWTLQNFQPNNCLDPKFNKLKPFTEEEFEELQKIIN